MIRAFRVVFSMETLPPTVVTALSSSSGEAKASSNPTASSTPGSQSMISLCLFTRPECGGSRVGASRAIRLTENHRYLTLRQNGGNRP